MTDIAELQGFETRIGRALNLHHNLTACFNALAEGRFDDPRLRRVVAATLTSAGLRADMPLDELLRAIEPLHTGMVVDEAGLLTETSEQSQLRMRLLLKSPRSVYGLAEMGDDDLFAPIAPVVATEIANLHDAYVPYAHQTAANFMEAAASYASGPALKGMMDGIEARRGQVALEYVKLQDGMAQGPMSIGELDAFYRGYTDMSYDPALDYARNTRKLCDLHITIAETNLARINLRITQAYMVLTNSAGREALATDAVFKKDFDTKFQETANAFQRTALHIEGGDLTNGPVYGARQYLQVAKAYTIA